MKIDWSAAKLDYVHDMKLSLLDIAKQYGLASTTVFERASKEEWTRQRREYLVKAERKLLEKTGNSMAEHQARLMRQAQFVAGEGLKGIVRHKPRSAREAKEMWEAGTSLQAKMLGFDKANVNVQNNTQNNFIGFEEFIGMMEERRGSHGR